MPTAARIDLVSVALRLRDDGYEPPIDYTALNRRARDGRLPEASRSQTGRWFVLAKDVPAIAARLGLVRNGADVTK